MREPLVIAVAQPPCVSLDVAANAVTHAATVRSARARVVVFPELSLTGYELDAPAIAVDDPRLTPIVDACAEAGSLALVGAPFQDDAGLTYIAVLAIDGSGATVAYRKMWLGGAEPARFSPGGPTTRCGWPLGALTHLVQLVGLEAMRLTMHARRGLLVGRLDKTPDLSALLINPVLLVVDAVLPLYPHIRFVRLRDILRLHTRQVVMVHEQRHGSPPSSASPDREA